MKHKLGEKIISLILTFNLVFSNFAPFVSLAAVRAQEVTPEPTIETSISPTDEPTPTEQISPTVEPTQDVTPTETVDVTPTVEATPVETATPVQEPTLAPEEAPSVPSPPSDSTSTSSTPTPLMSVAPTSEPSPTITPLMTPDGHVETQVIESYSCRSDSLNGCLITDKADYAPTDVAVITGYGFTPNTSYTLRIYSTDEPATDNTYQITTDSNGSFTYSYQLDGTYRPNYTVELKDTAGFVVAKVTFTDSDTSFLSPTASGINHNDWSNGSNAFISDNIYTTATTERDNQSYENFNFNIPNGSTINGIEVKIEAKSSDTSGCRLEPRLWSTSANNHSNRKFQELSGLDTVYTFGGSNDLWGITWTSSDFNNTNFHLEFQFDDVSGNSCNNSTVSVDHVQAKVYYTEAVPTNTPIPTPTPGSYSGVQTVIGSCMKDLSPHLTCTANDVSIANVTNIDITDPCDYPGDTATFTATWNVQSTAAQRYNIGLWFAANGQTSALNGTCAISTLPNGPVPPWYNFDNNACGDISSSSSVNPVITMTVKCEDPDGDNLLNLPYCTSWDQNSGQCSVPADTLPGSPSKCNCQNGFEVPITVPYKAKIEVKKILSPSDDSGRFNLNVDGSEKASCVGNNGTTGQINVSAGTSANPGAVHTVGETACTNPDTNLNDYTSSISCVDRGLATFNGGAPITQNGVGSLELNVDPNDDIVCTITNTKKGKIIIEKQTLPDGSSQTFDFTADYDNDGFSLTDGQQNDSGYLTPGTYSVAETSLTGWDLTSVVCSDQSDPSSISLQAGETVTCTFTNTQNKGSLKVNKKLDNDGNGTFETSNPSSFTWSLDGSGSYNMGSILNNILIGNHSINENSPSGYHFVGWYPTSSTQYSCSNPYSNSLPASVSVSANQTTEITLCNARDTGIVTITKDSIPDSSQDFSFDANPNFPGFSNDFSLDDDNNATLPNSRTFIVPTGSYTVTEGLVNGWKLTNLVCTGDDNSLINLSNRRVTLDIDRDENISCTFTNTKLGSITLGKDTNPEQSSHLKFNYSGTLGSSDFYDDDTDTYNNLLPGTYVITEAEKPGWYLNSISCSGGSSIVKDIPNRTLTIDLQPGENVNCTFNNYKKGKIYGEKFNDKDGDNYDDGSSEPELSGWTIYLDLNENDQLDNDEPTDVTNSSGRYSFENLMPGTYKVCEVMKDGWYPTTGSNCKTTTIHNNGGDEDEVNFANHQSITIKAYKIVCDLESKLPNWGNGAPNIISSTAQNFVDANEGCSLVPDWNFQWGFAGTGGVTKLAGNYIGPAPTGPADNQWKNFDSSTSGSNTPAEVVINDLKGYSGIWVRENLQSNYVPFSFTLGTPPGDSYSAELYCYKDGERYDNFDQVANPLYGSSYYCVAFNALNYGYLKVEKTTDPADDKTEFEVSISGTGTVNGSTTGLISDANDYTFEVTPGIYSVSETLPDDWRLISNNCSEIVVSAGETSTCEIVNEKFGKVKVTKYHDLNQDGQKQENEPVLSDWNIQLSEDEKNTDENGQVLYENLIKGEYELSETIKDGWNQTNISCEGDEEKDSDNSHIVIVKAGETTNCQIGNYQQPVLQIFKTNDGSTKSPGGSVIYTLKLKVLYNKILGVKIKDLLPKGFVFDHIVSSTLNGSDIVLANPVYSSPGTYDLGDLNIDDEVIIKYQANINSSQEFGLYKDISWALGKEEGTNDKILALAQPEGYVSENFVGTGVKVDGNITEGGNVNLQGEVLGASTQNILPATGGNQIWVIIASILTGAGLLLMIFGFFMNKVKKFLAIILLVIGFWLFGAGSVNAVSNNLSIRVSEPKTPTKNSDFKLVFTVLDLSDSGSPITVKCFYKKNLGDSWTQFDADKILIAGGNTDSCQVNSSIVNISGQTYYFKATATNGIDFDDSESQGLIAVGYDDRDPSVPTNYKKEKISNCQYKISFKTADDGQTSRVEVYRSENNSFNLDGSTRVGDIVIGPNTEGSFTEAVPDCNKNYYYVIRAFNSAGNSSGPIGDSGVVSSITSTTITQESGAIPVEGVTLPGGAAGGQILGEETEKGATPTAKPEVVEVKEKGVAGAVKGVADFVKNKTRLSLLIGLGVLVLGYGAYYFIKKRKTL